MYDCLSCCRLCLQNNDNLTINCLLIKELNEAIKNVFGFEILENDNFSTKICRECSYKVTNFAMYKDTVLRNQKSIEQYRNLHSKIAKFPARIKNEYTTSDESVIILDHEKYNKVSHKISEIKDDDFTSQKRPIIEDPLLTVKLKRPKDLDVEENENVSATSKLERFLENILDKQCNKNPVVLSNTNVLRTSVTDIDKLANVSKQRTKTGDQGDLEEIPKNDNRRSGKGKSIDGISSEKYRRITKENSINPAKLVETIELDTLEEHEPSCVYITKEKVNETSQVISKDCNFDVNVKIQEDEIRSKSAGPTVFRNSNSNVAPMIFIGSTQEKGGQINSKNVVKNSSLKPTPAISSAVPVKTIEIHSSDNISQVNSISSSVTQKVTVLSKSFSEHPDSSDSPIARLIEFTANQNKFQSRPIIANKNQITSEEFISLDQFFANRMGQRKSPNEQSAQVQVLSQTIVNSDSQTIVNNELSHPKFGHTNYKRAKFKITLVKVSNKLRIKLTDPNDKEIMYSQLSAFGRQAMRRTLSTPPHSDQLQTAMKTSCLDRYSIELLNFIGLSSILNV